MNWTRLLKSISLAYFISIAACSIPQKEIAPDAPATTESAATAKLKSLSLSIATPEYVNWNSLFNSVADEQGIEPGSALWTSGGMAAYSGQTGGHPSYGWNHSCKLSPDYARAVIANYGHRRVYYDNAPCRQSSYLVGGRPVGWIVHAPPEDAGDQSGGEAAYMTSKGIVLVSGPDALHAQFGPLFSLADSTGFKIKAKGQMYDASIIAKIMIRYQLKALRGQVMKTPDSVTSYIFSDRGTSIIMNATAQAIKRNLLDPDDAKWLSQYILNVALPYYEKAPGHYINIKENGLALPNFQIYNGLLWLIPPFYEASQLAVGTDKARFEAITKRLCQWYVDLDEIVPEYGGNIAAFAATDEIVKGIDGKPLPSLKGKLTKGQILKGDSPWDLWGFRAGMIAEKILGAPAKPLADKLRAKWLPKQSDLDSKVWLVGPDGSYVTSSLEISMRLAA